MYVSVKSFHKFKLFSFKGESVMYWCFTHGRLVGMSCRVGFSIIIVYMYLCCRPLYSFPCFVTFVVTYILLFAWKHLECHKHVHLFTR